MNRRIEIPWSFINGHISTYLRAHGIDDTKEMQTWCLWENNSLTLVFEQSEEAQQQVTEERKMTDALTKRPAYLDRKPTD